MNNERLLIIGILAFVLLILSAIFLSVIFFMRRRMATVSQWPSTLGMVNSSYLERRSSSEGGSTDYPVVHYSYQVGGRSYQSTKLAPGPEVGGTGAGKVVARYPEGAQVMVFYNPDKPSDAVLERRVPAQWLMRLLLIVFDCVLCGVIPVLYFSLGG